MKAGVTCCRKADRKKTEQALQWAAQLDLPYIPRREDISVPEFLKDLGLDWLLVVTSEGPLVYSESGKLKYHPGMAPLRILELERGNPDQMADAMGLRPGMRIFDGTLGLASDSLVASFAVGEKGKVVGTEVSLPVAFLTGEGLASYRTGKLSVDAAMRRIEVHHMAAKEYLKKVPPDSFDLCYFDPMFRTPAWDSSSMNRLRPLACRDALDEETLALGLKAAPLVVIKERGERSLREYGCTEIFGSRNAHYKFGRIYRNGERQ